jgi:hypothetical protein
MDSMNGLPTCSGLYLLLAGAWMVGACDAIPDRRPTLPDTPYAVRVADPVTLRGTETIPVDPPSDLVALDGRYVMAGTYVPHALTVYSQDGRPIRRRELSGEGPGEFQMIASLQPSSDGNLIVTDVGTGRRTVLDPSLEVIEDEVLPWAPTHRGHLALSNGEEVLRRPVSVDGTVRLLHKLDDRFRIESSFFPLAGDERDGHVVFMAPSVDSTFCTAQHYTHRIQRWSARGALLEDRSGVPPWFEPLWADFGPVQEGDPPSTSPAAVLDLHEDADGRIWILNQVPDPDHEASGRPVSEPALETAVERVDAVIEVRDARSWTLLAIHRMDAYGQRLLPGPVVQTYRTDRDGRPIVELFGLSLASP